MLIGMSDHPAPLTGKLGFHLRRAHEAAQQSLAAALAETGLAPVHADMLALIGAQPGIKPSQIAQLLGRDRSSITAALHVLEANGLIRRQATTRDRRATLLHLTDAGVTLLRSVSALVQAQDALLDRIVGPDDKSRMIGLLHRIHAMLAQGGNTR